MAEEITKAQKEDLVLSALKARENAYAPYSNFFVGAAVMTASGSIYSGCNVENASYGLTCCAERTAVFKALSEGDADLVACAVVAPGGGSPCGACRQVLNEFNPEMVILLADESGALLHELSLEELLPQAFGPQNLK